MRLSGGGDDDSHLAVLRTRQWRAGSVVRVHQSISAVGGQVAVKQPPLLLLDISQIDISVSITKLPVLGTLGTDRGTFQSCSEVPQVDPAEDSPGVRRRLAWSRGKWDYLTLR